MRRLKKLDRGIESNAYSKISSLLVPIHPSKIDAKKIYPQVLVNYNEEY